MSTWCLFFVSGPNQNWNQGYGNYWNQGYGNYGNYGYSNQGYGGYGGYDYSGYNNYYGYGDYNSEYSFTASFFLLLKQYKRVKFPLCSHVQINLVVMASRHDVVVTRTVTSRINRGNPPLEIGM